MRTPLSLAALVLMTLPFLFVIGRASAAVFPDVPDGSLYQEQIEALVQSGIIGGNPDGKFYPERKVNRAEMLKMLYLATGKVPDPSSRACFDDVEEGAWYEPYVCDAAARKYVQGYEGHVFRPADPVNRVEALKMVLNLFDITVSDISEEDRSLVKFVDVSVSAWYTKYLYAAFEQGILPIAGQEGGRIYPDWPLLRGEAAAYIFNALHAELRQARQTSSSSVSSVASTASAASQGTSSSVSTTQTSFDVVFPFSMNGKFVGKRATSFRFTLDKGVTASFVVSQEANQPGTLSCQLYKLEEGGFSFQYFVGFVEGAKCSLLVSLDPGNYQLQAQSTAADTTFSVTSSETMGDRNDGFNQAQALLRTVPKTGTLSPRDLMDWYKFTVTAETNMEVTASNGAEITCNIFPMQDVELGSFSNPLCNQRFSFPKGTYYATIGRKLTESAQQTYTILLQ
ncbi:MAG: S-layer homology domain-containing protein [Candidatus Peribacteraceae bacterium]|nr:S-layer homology domain-containing protein [Candidatus Peribacteraceae bacterium]